MGITITDPLVGQLVDGRYRVVSRIARGGMATVYLAVDRRLDREVALKVMHPHLAESSGGADFVARFRREARSAARLTHPGLVAVFDQGLDGETSYLTMEYIPGGNLRRRLAERGSLPVGEALDVVEQVLDALSAAHRAGLVHRDIKPENVLITAEGRIKVGDFGLARAVTEVTSATTGTVLGTVAYLAPELVVRGASDTRTDVYAAGVLLYEAITGEQPFTGATAIQIAYQHVNSDVPSPSEIAEWLPTEVDALIAALTARDPTDRPTDAAAALALLRRTRDELDPETLERRVPVDPAPLPVAGGSATDPEDEDQDGPEDHDDARDGEATSRIDALSPGGTVALPIGLGTAVAPVTAPEEPRHGRRRRRWALLAGLVVLVIAAAAGGTWWYLNQGPGAYTTVPEVSSLSQADAESLLDAAGLESGVEQSFDDVVPAGSVVSADPGDGQRVRKDGTVTLTVSRGPDLVQMPEGVVGAMQADAEAALTEAGLSVDYESAEYSDDQPNGQVMSAVDEDGAPVETGQDLKRDALVLLTVSKGPEPLTLFSVVGATVDEATEQLENAGLKITTTDVWSDTVAKGSIVSQSPGQGTEVKRTDTITVQVSQGPEPVELPDLTGKSYTEAAEILEGLGLHAERENVLGGIFGTVRSQSVKAGESAPKGSTITLQVV